MRIDQLLANSSAEGSGPNHVRGACPPALPPEHTHIVQRYHDRANCKRRRIDEIDTYATNNENLSAAHFDVVLSNELASGVHGATKSSLGYPTLQESRSLIPNFANQYIQDDTPWRESSLAAPASGQESYQEFPPPCKNVSVDVVEICRADGPDERPHPDIVCYGMLERFDTVQLKCDLGPVELHWDSHSEFTLDHGQVVHLSDRSSAILSYLRKEVDLEFDLRLEDIELPEGRENERKRHIKEDKVLRKVSVVVYGPRSCAEDVGLWLDEIELYLQMPTFCSRNVPYSNPHAMTLSANTEYMTGELTCKFQAESESSTAEPRFVCHQNAIGPRDYPEARQPSSIRSQLQSHQLKALRFMQGREAGWDLDNERGTDDLWRRESDSFGREKYCLILSGELRFKQPTEFRGGILADEMGLGKTCTMLSLIVSDIPTPSERAAQAAFSQAPTLIIVPLPLLQAWEKQITEHIAPGTVAVGTYYDLNRASMSFTSNEIVLTTYNLLAKEWKLFKKCSKGNPAPPLYATTWHRIVLDEAHVIKNKDTDVARAASALNGDRRWCITGTPVQNQMLDIYSLFRFLKVYPYDNYKIFEATFVKPWFLHVEESALNTLQALVSTISIRRHRAVITLPPREESICWLNFSQEELELYDRAKHGAFQSIDTAIAELSSHNRGFAYLNALQKINDLRYICNHGLLPRPKKLRSINLREEQKDNLIKQEIEVMFTTSMAVSGFCDSCGFDLLDDLEEASELLDVPKSTEEHIGPNSCPSCGARILSTQGVSPSVTPSSSTPSSRSFNLKLQTSSKVQALLREIQQSTLEEKCVVFSYWTSTLKFIGQALGAAGISFLLYNGSLSRVKRDATLSLFAEDPACKVLLVSITCGGQGLDLTAANHAFIFEPQWNPMLEEQAMARVHRMGQTKPVRLTRLIVRNTWEEKIVTLQKRKRLLADLIVDSKKIGRTDDTRQQLLWLRDLVS